MREGDGSRIADAEVGTALVVQKLESAWRGLKFVIDRTDFREGNKVELLNISKEQLLEDFEDSPEVVRSGLYKLAYTAEYGQFGGEPYAAMISNYDFGPGAQDVALLQNCASVASMAHAPFIAALLTSSAAAAPADALLLQVGKRRVARVRRG